MEDQFYRRRLRKQVGELKRTRPLYTSLTKEEFDCVLAYCRDNSISQSKALHEALSKMFGWKDA